MRATFLWMLFFGTQSDAFVYRDNDTRWTYRSGPLLCADVGCCTVDFPCSPENWYLLSNETYHRCRSDAHQQSPINIETLPGQYGMETTNDTIKATQTTCNGTIVLRQNTWEVDFQKNTTCTLQWRGDTWQLLNWHIHNAEHSIDGVYYPLEIHLVHQRENDTQLMVCSVFVSISDNDHDFFEWVENTPDNDDKIQEMRPYSLFRRDPSYWSYVGSLTTPPCTPSDTSDVLWIVHKEPVYALLSQVEFFTRYLERSNVSYNGRVNRPTQPVLPTTIVYEYTHRHLRSYRHH